LIEQGSTPGGTRRNWASYGHLVGEITELQKSLLCDPQTSGGLLVAVENDHVDSFKKVAKAEGFELESIGELSERKDDSKAYINVK